MSHPPEDDFDDSANYLQPPKRNMAVPPVRGGNPLAGYFRLPGVHVALPTRGAFLPKGSTHLVNGEVAVLPMRAQDELLLKNPDALMSGLAIEKLLESCAPSIGNPKLISVPDLDVLLLAIRVASSGELMDINVNCPKCETQNIFSCNLPALLSSVEFIEPDAHVRLSDDVIAYVRPYNIDNGIEMSLATYDETQKMKAVEADATVDNKHKITAMNTALGVLADLKFTLMAQCVVKIVVPGSEVTDRKHIADFIANVDRRWVNAIEKKIDELNVTGLDKKIDIECINETCKHQWQTEVEFNPSNFFEDASSK